MNLQRLHIINTLGIAVPLNESIQLGEKVTFRIIQEQMIYETFLDSIKDFAKEKYDTAITTFNTWKDAAVVMGKVLSNPQLLADFISPLQRRVQKLVQPLIDFLKKYNLEAFAAKVTELLKKIDSLNGWKKFLVLTSVGGIITYILSKLKSLAPDALKSKLASFFGDDFLTNLLSHITDFRNYLSYMEPIIQGVQSIFDFLKPLIDAFSQAIKSGNRMATKLIRETKMKKSELKQMVLEAMAGGYVKGRDGKLVPHYDKFDSTKLSSILTQIVKGRPEEGDPIRGNKILDKANPDNVARITRGEKPVYEGAEQDYTVIFYVNDMDYDWDVKATSPEDAIAKVKSGEVKGPYDQTLPRTARAFSAKLKK